MVDSHNRTFMSELDLNLLVFCNTIWMSPEMLKSDYSAIANFQLPKSDMFCLGLIALYCLDTKNFNNHKKELNKDEKALSCYLDDFYFRCQNKLFFYMLKCMLSYSPHYRPSVRQLLQDFPEFFINHNQNQPVI